MLSSSISSCAPAASAGGSSASSSLCGSPAKVDSKKGDDGLAGAGFQAPPKGLAGAGKQKTQDSVDMKRMVDAVAASLPSNSRLALPSVEKVCGSGQGEDLQEQATFSRPTQGFRRIRSHGGMVEDAGDGM